MSVPDDHPVSILQAEHRLIFGVLDAMDREAEHLDRGKTVDPAFWHDVCRFLVEYCHGWHESREEDLLIRPVERCLGDRQALRQLRDNHEEFERLLGHACRCADDGDAVETASRAHRMAGTVREHLLAEQRTLFPLAVEHLDADQLRDAFELVDEGPAARRARELEALARSIIASVRA